MYTGNLVDGDVSSRVSGTSVSFCPPAVTWAVTGASRAPLAGPVAVETTPMPLAARAAPTARAESWAVRAAAFAIPGRTIDESHMTGAAAPKKPWPLLIRATSAPPGMTCNA